MRESCFRGKRIPHGEWVAGFYAKSVDYFAEKERSFIQTQGLNVNGGENLMGNTSLSWFEVDPDTVGEFSGKRDKNDRRIFEGDIVDGLFRFNTPVRAVCVFKDGAFGLAWTYGGVDHFSAFTSICNVKYEVVGNIYDNPELLEVEE